MPDTIENPTADQLEVDGLVTGTKDQLFTFTDTPLIDRGHGELGLINDAPVVVIGIVGQKCYAADITITSYTPPEKPWEDWADDDLIEVDNSKLGDGRSIHRAAWLRGEHTPAWIMASHPRRVLVADADTDLVVPRAAVERLANERDRLAELEGINSLTQLGSFALRAIRDFLAAVYERGERWGGESE